MKKKLLSIILPIYNEEVSIPIIYKELLKVLNKLQNHYAYEILFINDGSSDNSLEKLKIIKKKDKNIKIINFSRNFGHQAALTCGLNEAQGDFIITIDADLQDPPELILKMLKKAEKGIDVIYARRKKRHDGFIKKIFAKCYYYILKQISDVDIPSHVGDYRLINKKVLNALNKCHENARYIRGLVAWLGFSYDFVEFDRPGRKGGITGYSWKKMFKLGFDGFTGFSSFPLRIAAFMGIFVTLTSLFFFCYVVYDFSINNTPYPLYKWLVIVIYGFIGVQFILIWILGEYIGRIYDEQKGRPMYIVSDKI